jgi:hypothetical protein
MHTLFQQGIEGGVAIGVRHVSYPNMLFVRYFSSAGQPTVRAQKGAIDTAVYYSVLSPEDVDKVR